MVSVVIPIFKQEQPEYLKISLPSSTQNLFERIIRDPTNPDRPARETRCAEMLCVLLLNCEVLKLHFFEQFAAMFGWHDLPLAELEYDIETEQAIGSKRDDLRIEGYRVNDDERERILLWTMEIKVQAGIHQSSYQEYENTSLPVETTDSVPQIENYDRWLTAQDVRRKGGIVLSIPDLQAEVTELNIRNRWCCIRWTDLGSWAELAVDNGTLPETELVLTKHFLGFLWKRLWDPTEMNMNKLGIDDLALIRAFATHGLPCEKKINALVEPLLKTLTHSGITLHSDPKHQQTLFRSYIRSTAGALLLPDTSIKPSPYLTLMVGVEGDDAHISIQSNRSCPWKFRFRAVCIEHEAALKERNPGWCVNGDDDTTWVDVVLQKPLTWLLVEDDQAAALNAFVEAGLEDLKATGIIDALQAIPQEQEP